MLKRLKKLLASKDNALILSTGGRLEYELILDGIVELFLICLGVSILL